MDYNERAKEFAELMSGMMRRSAHKPPEETVRGETGILMYLGGRHDGASAGELKEAMGVGSGRIANALKDLEAKGLVVRSRSPRDRRSVQVCLTDRGRAFSRARKREFLAVVQHLMEELGETDTEELLRLMRRIVEIKSETKERL